MNKDWIALCDGTLQFKNSLYRLEILVVGDYRIIFSLCYKPTNKSVSIDDLFQDIRLSAEIKEAMAYHIVLFDKVTSLTMGTLYSCRTSNMCDHFELCRGDLEDLSQGV